VIPAHNRGPYVVNTLTTLCGQTHDPQDFEVVLVNDGSTDGTGELVRELRLPFRLTYLERANTNCRAEARNVGVRAARGQVLLFLDAEMLCPPGLVAAHLDMHRRYGPCVVAGWDHRIMMVPGAPLPPDWLEQVETLPREVGCIPGVNLAWHLRPFVTSNVSCRRADLLEVGLFDEAFRGYGHEDLDAGLRLHLLGRPFVSDPSLVAYHQAHPRSPAALQEVQRNVRYYYRKHHRRRHVVHFLDALVCGGVERIILGLARHLHGRQHLFTVVINRRATHYTEEFAALGVPIYRLDHSDLGHFLAVHPVDLVHIHYSPTEWLPHLLSAPTPVPMMATVHSEVRLPPHPRLRRITCLGHSIAALQPGPAESYRVIYPGTDCQAFAPQGRQAEARAWLGLPSEAFVVGTAVRVDPDKVSPRLLNLYRELVRQRPDLHVVLMGDGYELPGYRHWLAAQGLDDRVHLVGPVADVSFALEALDVVVHAVEREAFGVAVLEALAKGLPVVAPRTGGLRETVEDGSCGFLCGTGRELVQRVLELADGVHDWRALRRNALARARLFDERRTALKYKLTYDEVIDGARYLWPVSVQRPRALRPSSSVPTQSGQ